MDRLRAAGYAGQFTPLEEGVRRYVQDHLAAAEPLRVIPVLLFPNLDPVADPDRAAGDSLVRARLYRRASSLSWRLMRRLVALAPAVATATQVDDFVSWATLGVVLGGRLGYCLFYQPCGLSRRSDRHPAGLDRRHEFSWRHAGRHASRSCCFAAAIAFRSSGFADRLAVCAPIGLGLGRDRQFHQRRTVGAHRAGQSALGDDISRMPTPMPRHPSQIYQALMEGLVLFLLMLLAVAPRIGPGAVRHADRSFPDRLCGGADHRRVVSRAGRISGLSAFGATMGQLLSIPMLLAGCGWRCGARPEPSTGPSTQGWRVDVKGSPEGDRDRGARHG